MSIMVQAPHLYGRPLYCYFITRCYPHIILGVLSAHLIDMIQFFIIFQDLPKFRKIFAVPEKRQTVSPGYWFFVSFRHQGLWSCWDRLLLCNAIIWLPISLLYPLDAVIQGKLIFLRVPRKVLELWADLTTIGRCTIEIVLSLWDALLTLPAVVGALSMSISCAIIGSQSDFPNKTLLTRCG